MLPTNWRKQWQSIPVLLPGESHRQRSLAGYGPWHHKESDTTERLTLHTTPPTNVSSQASLYSIRFCQDYTRTALSAQKLLLKKKGKLKFLLEYESFVTDFTKVQTHGVPDD